MAAEDIDLSAEDIYLSPEALIERSYEMLEAARTSAEAIDDVIESFQGQWPSVDRAERLTECVGRVSEFAATGVKTLAHVLAIMRGSDATPAIETTEGKLIILGQMFAETALMFSEERKAGEHPAAPQGKPPSEKTSVEPEDQKEQGFGNRGLRHVNLDTGGRPLGPMECRFRVTDATILSNGDVLQIDTEYFVVNGLDPDGRTVYASGANFGTVHQTHQNHSAVFLITSKDGHESVPFPPVFPPHAG